MLWQASALSCIFITQRDASVLRRSMPWNWNPESLARQSSTYTLVLAKQPTSGHRLMGQGEHVTL
jgi:hypothetical protein